jgi:glycosyltransferase involved in cell wall biosynthesis
VTKVLFVLTEDWFFLSHFQPIARAARRMGAEVVVAARQSSAATRIADLGYRLIPNEIGRSGLDPLGVVRSVRALRAIIDAEQPDVIHAIALVPVVVAALATLGSGRRVILAPTGLGHLWLEQDVATVLVRHAVRLLLAATARRERVHFLFENAEDPRVFGLDPNDATKVTVIGGAGVSATEFAPSELPPAPPLRVAVVARMTAPKGIAPVVEAVSRLRETGRDVRLDLYGAPDPDNRRSIAEATLRGWDAMDGITWHGPTASVSEVWARTHVAALLSWREGLPRSLVEAMACGRPVVTTDVPGCRTLVRDGAEGFLVPVESVDATMAALRTLYDHAATRNAMGVRARERFEAGFTEEGIERTASSLYVQLLGRPEQAP